MAREERTSRTWMSMVTVVWVVFGLAVVGLILWYGGIIGGGPGNGGDVVTQEDSADNGNGNGNGEDAEADQNGNGDEAADGNGNGDVTAEDNGNGEQADDQAVSVFTSEQAERGEEAYSQSCAECHGGQLDGDPPLTGNDFASTWEGMPVNALYEVISQTMPQDSPGSLDEETYNDVTAHILAFNGMADGDSELQSGDSGSMETLISFDGAADENGDAQADADGEDANGEDQAAENGEDTDAEADDTADGNGASEENGEAEADAGEDNGDSQAEGEGIEVEETADGEPGAGEGWIDLTVDPQSATINVLGPAGYMGQLQGSDGTITGLEPGSYVFTASLGNFSHRVDAEVRARETVNVNLLISELAGSPDVNGGEQNGENGDTNGAADEQEQNGNGADANGNGNGNGDNGANDEDANGDNGNDGNGNGSNGNDAWYTEEQAEAGAEDYSASCASCHGEDGTGGSDPPLADGALEGSFETVWDLFDYTSTEMPDDDPGGLDEETYVNITAHMLALNDYSSGDEELEADEDQMSDMSLSNGDGGNGEAGNGNGNGEDADADANGESADQDSADANGEDAETNGEATEGTSAERGASLYSSNCAMCHGQTLHGVDAPPLAGPVFMERWGGHPVEWFYFQAHTSMPPDTPGSLDDQAYVDIIVHVLAENGMLEGDEEFVHDDLLLRSMIIGTTDQQDGTLQNRIEELRRTVHEPFEEAEAEDPEAGADETGVPEGPETGGPESPVPFEDSEGAQEADNGENDEANGNDEDGGEETGGDFVDDMIMPEESEVPPAGAESIDDGGGEGTNGGNGE